MSWFQLDPASVAQRARAGTRVPDMPGLAGFLVRGIVGFTVLSIAGFAPWAITGRWFYRHLGEGILYAICAAVFIGLSGPLLHRLILGPGSLPRIYKLFGLSFAAYSVLWIVGWMSLRGHPGSLTGLLAGTAAMGWMLACAFDARAAVFKIIAALFVLNSIGYFVGGWVEGAMMGIKPLTLFGNVVARPTQAIFAKLLWGVCYGIGFGSGLGLAFHWCQTRTREMLRQLDETRKIVPELGAS